MVNKKVLWVDIKSNRIVSTSNEYLLVGLISQKEIQLFLENKNTLKKVKRKVTTKNIEFIYSIDRTVINIRHEEYIYLYTLNHNHYGIKKDMIHLEYMDIIKIPHQETIKSWAPISKKEVYKLVYELILLDRDPHHMLHHVLEKFEKDYQIKHIDKLDNMKRKEELHAVVYK